MTTALFFDLDGTLAVNDGHNRCIVPGSNLRCLEALRDRNYLLAACTGRQAAFVEELFPGIFSAIIANSGSLLLYEGETVYQQSIPQQEARRLAVLLKEKKISSTIVKADEVHVVYCSQGDEERIRDNYFQGAKIVSEEDLSFDDALMFDIFFHDYDEYLSIKDHLSAQMRLNLHENIKLPCDLSIGCDKGKGVKVLKQHATIDRSYGFGDGINDIPLFNEVDISIAMGNAPEAVKKAADYVTDAVDKEGLYKALIHFGLLEEEL